MIRVSHISLALLLLALMNACSSDSGLSAVEYVQWVQEPENGLRQTTQQGPFTFTMQYEPVTYRAIREHGVKQPSASAVEKVKKEMEGLQYFLMEITAQPGAQLLPTTNNGAMSEEAHKYLSYDIYQDMQLVTAGDTLDCVMHNYETPVEGMKRLRLQFAFEKAEVDSVAAKQVIFHDRLWTKQPLQFNFRQQDLAAIPAPKI